MDGDGASRRPRKRFSKRRGWVGAGETGRSQGRFVPSLRELAWSWSLRWQYVKRGGGVCVSPGGAFSVPGQAVTHMVAQMEPRCGFLLPAASLQASAGKRCDQWWPWICVRRADLCWECKPPPCASLPRELIPADSNLSPLHPGSSCVTGTSELCGCSWIFPL